MIYTLERLLYVTRFQSNQNYNTSSMNSAVETSYIDTAQELIASKLLQYRPDMMSSYIDITLTGAERYYIPDSARFNYDTILFSENITDSSNPLPSIPTDWQDRLKYLYGDIQPDDEVWSIRDQYIEFPRKPSGETWRVWVSRRPTGLFYGTVGTGSASTTIVFPTTVTAGEIIPQNDYYIGMKVHCNGEVKLITDYVASTKTATISGTWSTTPLNTHTMSLISSLPDVLHVLIADVAAMFIKGKANDDQIDSISRLIDNTFATHITQLSTPQNQMPGQITKISRL
jgi:hypothetical protein